MNFSEYPVKVPDLQLAIGMIVRLSAPLRKWHSGTLNLNTYMLKRSGFFGETFCAQAALAKRRICAPPTE
jgi:hypothetical protein